MMDGYRRSPATGTVTNPKLPMSPVRVLPPNGINGAFMPLTRHQWSIHAVNAASMEH
jgi:hypothetical protein